jgi:hypothetical protein
MKITAKLDRILELLENKQAETPEEMSVTELEVYLQYRYKLSSLYTMSCTGTIPCTHKPLRFHKKEIDNWLKSKK